MTTTVKRGAGRPAATQRRNRHAQNTALPPKATAEAEATRTALADPAAETPEEAKTQYGRMTVDELKARAKALGVTPLPRAKGALLNAILYVERANQVTEAVKNAEEGEAQDDSPFTPTPGPQPAEKAPAATSAPEGNSGVRKALKLAEQVKAAGWTSEWNISSENPNRVQSVSRRGSEILTVTWDSGVFNYELSGHLIDDRHTKIRNVSHGRQLAARGAGEAQAELARVTSNRAFRPREAKGGTARGKLPFDPETATEAEIKSAILGKYLVWINRVSNTEEHATATKSDRYTTVSGEGAERVVQFCSDIGFRALRLSALLRVGTTPTRKRSVAEEEQTAA